MKNIDSFVEELNVLLGTENERYFKFESVFGTNTKAHIKINIPVLNHINNWIVGYVFDGIHSECDFIISDIGETLMELELYGYGIEQLIIPTHFKQNGIFIENGEIKLKLGLKGLVTDLFLFAGCCQYILVTDHPTVKRGCK